MRIPVALLLTGLAACADTGTGALTQEGGGPGPMLTAGTCSFTVSKVGTDPISAAANSTGNDAAAWFLQRPQNGVGVKLVGELFNYSGAVTSATHSSWITFPDTLPTYPQTIDADVFFGTGAAGTGTIGMTVRYVCADGTDTLTASIRKFGSFGVDVN